MPGAHVPDRRVAQAATPSRRRAGASFGAGARRHLQRLGRQRPREQRVRSRLASEIRLLKCSSVPSIQNFGVSNARVSPTRLGGMA